MSITGALSNAMSGLSASQRMAEVASSNVANALNEDYGKRSVLLGSRGVGTSGGVRIIGIERHVDAAILADRRNASAGQAEAQARSAFLDRVAADLGVPGSGYALADRLAAVEAALVSASAQPHSTPALTEVATALDTLARQVGEMSGMLQAERSRADAAIASDVASLNETLARIADLNGAILANRNEPGAVAGLMDQRQGLIDRVAEIVPVKSIDRGHGTLALMTPSGAMLLDGLPAKIGFTPSGAITPHVSLDGGTLSGLTINGREQDLSRADHKLAGGRLAGNLAIRDTLAPEAQTELDAFARDLIERFADPAVDPTRPTGAPGLLTDAGAAFDPASEIGLAGRLRLNAAVDPARGGEPWRLRDGLGAAAAGDPGDASGLLRLADALSSSRIVASGSFAGSPRAAADLLGDIQAGIGGRAVAAADRLAYTAAQTDALDAAFADSGVDSDAEMQSLLLIEQAYAANARVIETVEAMLDTLTRL